MDKELKEGAYNAVRVCMNVQPEDKVFILTVEETRTVGEALAIEGKASGAEIEMRLLEEYDQRPITSVPEMLAQHIIEFKPTVSFFAASAKEGELAMRMGLSASLSTASKVRHGHMVNITERLMREGMRADYQEIYELTMRVLELVKDAREIHVTSRKGSEFTASFDPVLRWIPSHGLYHEPGDWGNLPEGEVFTCPESLEGIIVADVLGDYFSPKYGVLEKPVTFALVAGMVEEITSENTDLVEELWAYLNSSENGRRAGEFAIGTNTAIKALTGNLLQDEKIPGVHVAFGNPYADRTGADWVSKVHLDVIPIDCDIIVDGARLMEKGKFVFQ